MKIFDCFDVSLVTESLADVEEFICGTEYEIEDIKKVKLPGNAAFNPANSSFSDESPHWVGSLGIMRDGSLRNNGLEFITKPVIYSKALELFDTLHNNLELGPGPYTARTSIHVHVNMASMTMDQIKHFLLTYALLEPVFFEFAGPARKHNIHCVPLNFTLLPAIYASPLKDLVKNWSKYSAFNLVPLRTQGTIEFRHLFGTGDKKVYQAWLTMLRDLWQFAWDSPPNALEEMLRQGSTPQQICKSILPTVFCDNTDFTSSLIDVKLAF